MCGIAGQVNRPEELAQSSCVQAMCDAIVHRGPDEQGIYVSGPVGLGMRRLSIIDVAAGHQPIRNEDGTVWVVFNGEIYNFLELRAELESCGHRFYTHSDTEVIVHLYERDGTDFVKSLRGMFAVALYDVLNQKLVLARDRFGKKPLHYALHQGRLLFGSEIKSLLAVAPDLAQLSPSSFLNYFALRYIPDPLTAFRAIQKLPPGHVAEYQHGRFATRCYWQLPSFGTGPVRSAEEWLEQLEAELARAVRIRLISEVPLGALLSGGVDSSVVVALMARASSKVKTFSIGFGAQEFSETQHARAVAEVFATEHRELHVEPQILTTLERLTGHIDEPFGDSSMLPTFEVCALARQFVTVALAGDGGDELFAGYDRYTKHVERSKFNFLPSSVARWYRRSIHPALPARTPGVGFAYNFSLPNAQRYLDSISVLCAWERDSSVFSPQFIHDGMLNHSPEDDFCEVFDRAAANDVVSRLQYVDAQTYLPGDILTKVDRMSMATSLEVRAPLLDHVFAEIAASIPIQLKIAGTECKSILKLLAERLGVPRSAIYRKKQGFAVPLVHWFRQELRREVAESLLDSRTMARGYFNRRGIERMLEEHFSGRRDRSEALWVLLVFELWQRNFLEARVSQSVHKSFDRGLAPVNSVDVIEAL